jgi:uncharacterized membrane protein
LFQFHAHISISTQAKSPGACTTWFESGVNQIASRPDSKGAQVPDETAQAGLSDNAAGALAYVTIIPAIIFLVVAPYNTNSYIRFHSWQSIFLGIAAFAIDLVLTVIPVIGWILIPIFALGFLVLWIIVLLKALKGERFSLPVIGPLAAKQAGQ